MTTSLTAYTPLESLLLFQSLASYGIDPAVFSRTSDLLKNNPHVRESATFDDQRLSPDSLRDLYLLLLKAEARSELEDGRSETAALSPDAQSPNPRKRKAPSPTLPTIQEAEKHAHLIPKLVAKLYSRYRAHITQEIREEERRWDRLNEEVREIELGQWDDRLKPPPSVNGDAHAPVDGPVPDKISPAQEADARKPLDAAHEAKAARGSIPEAVPGGVPAAAPDAMAETTPGAMRETQPKVTPVSTSVSILEAAPQDASSAAAVEKAIEQQSAEPQPLRPQSPIKANVPSPQTKAETAPNQTPVVPAISPKTLPSPSQPAGRPLLPQVGLSQHPHSPTVGHPAPHSTGPSPSLSHVQSTATAPLGPGYGQTPPVHQFPYGPPQRPPSQGPTPSPKTQQARPISTQPGSPNMLPPQAPAHGAPFPPHSPFAENGAPPYRPPAGPAHPYSPSQRYAPAYPQGGPHPMQPPPPQGYYPPYPAHQHPYPPIPPQQTQPIYYSPPPHIGGYMLPPFQVTPQDPTRAHQVQRQAQQQQQPQTPTPTPAPVASRSPHPRLLTSAPPPSTSSPAIPNGRAVAATPLQRGPRPAPLAIATPGSETRWKASTTQPPQSPQRAPTVSPIDDVAPTPNFPEPPAGASPAKAKPKRGPRAKDAGTQENETAVDRTPIAPPPPPPPPANEEPQAEPVIRQMRSGRRQTKRRGGSAASSAVAGSLRGRTRSQSVASHAEAASVDDESSSVQQVKPEPSTPAGILEDDTLGPDATPSGPATRRRGAVQASKRKRPLRDDDASFADEPEGTPVVSVPGSPPPLPKPNVVIAPRHFPRMAHPIMNDIMSHKHASLFSAPVKEKDAEGYHDIIRRPTDLKTIKTAINAGSKIVNSYAQEATTGTPTGGGGSGIGSGMASPGAAGANVILPLSADVVPPKAIVNSAQLERELMRMFANAVMFNSGEEGVVADAREMFESVQGSVSNWRSAERTTAAAEGVGAAGGGGGGGGGVTGSATGGEDTPMEDLAGATPVPASAAGVKKRKM